MRVHTMSDSDRAAPSLRCGKRLESILASLHTDPANLMNFCVTRAVLDSIRARAGNSLSIVQKQELTPHLARASANYRG